jgi:DNA-binding MarR family transcriptional regulator
MGMSAKDQNPSPSSVELPLSRSVGYQIRTTHRLIQRYLQLRIHPHRVTLGMWYFLRVLWNEDGLTQRELSNRVGAMEPTTLSAILSMENRGLVKRVRDSHDRRKWNIFLTSKGRKLKDLTLPLAADVVNEAVAGFSEQEIDLLLKLLGAIQSNIGSRLDEFDTQD